MGFNPITIFREKLKLYNKLTSLKINYSKYSKTINWNNKNQIHEF